MPRTPVAALGLFSLQAAAAETLDIFFLEYFQVKTIIIGRELTFQSLGPLSLTARQ